MNQTLKKICQNVIDSHIDRMCDLTYYGKIKDAKSLHKEIAEWIISRDVEVLHLDYIDPFDKT